MSKREWLPIPGWSEFEASSDGYIRCATTGRLVSVRARVYTGGVLYRTVRLRAGVNCRKEVKVANLVCAAFHGQKPNARQVCRHLNGNSIDDAESNVAWGTQRQNIEDRDRHGRTSRGSRHYFAKLTEDDVRSIRGMLTTGGLTQGAIGKMFGVTNHTVCDISRRKSWKSV